jgi:integrase
MPAAAILFPITGRETSEIIAADCRRAGIPIERNGRFLDFHSLRTTFGTTLGRRGVPPVVAQKLMRHGTPVLTVNMYSQFSIAELAKAVEKLPATGDGAVRSSGGQAQ